MGGGKELTGDNQDVVVDVWGHTVVWQIATLKTLPVGWAGKLWKGHWDVGCWDMPGGMLKFRFI
jgi:hypothetical protein